MNVTTIADPDDPRVAAYRDVRERDAVGRQGLFVAEGEVVLRVLLGPAARFAADSILVAAKRLPALAPLLERAGATPVFAAEQAVMDRIAGFAIHRGVLAIGRIGTPLSAAAILDGLGARAMVVAAFGIANHDNIGGIFRTTAALGGPHAAVLLSPGCCDPLYRKALRVSIGHALRVPFTVTELDSGLWELLAARGFPTLALTPDPAAQPLQASASERGKLALVLGAEGPGLQPRTLDQIARAGGRHIRIPMTHGVDSLNVVVAAGIALSRLAQPDA